MTWNYVVTGTGTGIGKTVVAAGIAAALGAHYWKPIQAGLDQKTDSEAVAELGGCAIKSIVPEAYRLETPCSPHEAARIDGVHFDFGRLCCPATDGRLVIEGAGGVMVPITSRFLMLDLFASWGFPILLVASTALGTINHSLLSIEAIRHRGLTIAGVIFVGNANEASEETILGIGNVPGLGRLPWLDPLDRKTLANAIESYIRLDLLK